jgi:hypothetical protein
MPNQAKATSVKTRHHALSDVELERRIIKLAEQVRDLEAVIRSPEYKRFLATKPGQRLAEKYLTRLRASKRR